MPSIQFECCGLVPAGDDACLHERYAGLPVMDAGGRIVGSCVAAIVGRDRVISAPGAVACVFTMRVRGQSVYGNDGWFSHACIETDDGVTTTAESVQLGTGVNTAFMLCNDMRGMCFTDAIE